MSDYPAVYPLIQLLRPSKLGIQVGEIHEIPPTAIGVIVTRTGVALDRLPPGTFEVSEHYLPQTFKHLRLKPLPGTRAEVNVFAVYPAGSRTISWGSEFTVSNAEHPGLNVAKIAGRVQFRIIEPGLFIAGLLNHHRQVKGKNTHQTFKLTRNEKAPMGQSITTLDQNAPTLLSAAVGDIAANLALSTFATPVDAETARMQVQHRCQEPLMQWMQQAGLRLEAFSVDELPPPEHAPCCKCGSRTAPTGRVTFRRVVGLVYLLLHWRFEGNYCLPCGLKTGFTENAIMLVAGWWGLISALMTPIFIINNLYSMVKLAVSPRRPTTTEGGIASQATYLGPGS